MFSFNSSKILTLKKQLQQHKSHTAIKKKETSHSNLCCKAIKSGINVFVVKIPVFMHEMVHCAQAVNG